MYKVIFFGSSIHSLPALSELLKQDYIEVVSVVTQPDRPIGRRQVLTETPVSLFAKKNNISVIKPESDKTHPWLYKNAKDFGSMIQIIKPDLLIVCYYGQKIPKKIIDAVKYGGLNIHPSLLPKYRGAAPAEWAILKGEKETGVTILTIEQEFDQGKIIAQEKEKLFENDTPEIVYQRLFKKGAELLIKILPDYLNGKISPISQISLISPTLPLPYAPRLKKEDGKIDWSKSPSEIERKIRAFSPWPGTFTYVKPDIKSPLKRLKLLKSHMNEDKLIIDIVQLEGKNPVSFEQFKSSYPNCEFV